MLRPDFASAAVSQAFAQEAQRIALPLDASALAASAGTGSFSAMLNEVRSEVTDFVTNGSSGMAGTALSAEGYAQRARLQAALQGVAFGPPLDAAGTGVDRTQQQDFIASVAPWARETANRLGVSPELVTAHAALESGWGQFPLRTADGSVSHNLFGLKTGSAWTGDSVRALTTEVENGVSIKRQEEFRSYADVASAFSDYSSLLLDNPRYRSAINAGDDAQAFARGLARGNYATDPSYAHKLERVARQVRDIGLPANSSTGLKVSY
jgi:flagellar protein FlgJ